MMEAESATGPTSVVPAAAPLLPPPAPVVQVPLPAPALEAEPEPEPQAEPAAQTEYGWAREDTREFEPLSAMPEPEPEPEPEHHREEEAPAVKEPVFERIPGNGSRDFDWGE
jgi:hypothetical protein